MKHSEVLPLRYFFITCLGRSGSKYLAHLLDQADGVVVAHEPFPEDFLYLPVARYGASSRAVSAYLHERRSRIEVSLPDSTVIYGEVNSLLRYFLPEMHEVFDQPFLAFLVRNGRDFIRSAWGRSVYTERSLHGHILPADSDPWAGNWTEWSRFEKLAWYWDHTNQHLLRQLPVWLRLEDEATAFAPLSRKILEPLGLRLDVEVFERLKNVKRNTSRGYGEKAQTRGLLSLFRSTRPEMSSALGPWTEEMEATFQTICGRTMSRLGYE
jgi:hypothetical protein